MGIAADFLKKLCTVWRTKLELADQNKTLWANERDQCMTFVCGHANDFWESQFQKKFLGTRIQAKFQISMNKAFEVIAVFGPMLYARNPTRTVSPYEPPDIDPGVFGDPADPTVQMLLAQLTAQQRMETARTRTRCSVVERYLNYTPNEQPDGGLQQHAEDAITDALIGGLGLLWPDRYTMPGSERKLTGCFYRSSDYFLADPDARTFDFGKCTWIARGNVTPVWELERLFKLRPGALKRWAFRESAKGQAARAGHSLGNLRKIQGETHDLIEWWEIWSTGGIGCRLKDADESLRVGFDDFIGDYAYLALAAPGQMPFPLNCPPEAMETESVEEIQQRFRWPIPFWQDRRWPCAMLSFYKHPRRQYPIAPLAPALGELIFMTFLISRLANHVWQSSRQFVAVLQSARKEVERLLKFGGDLAVFGIKDMNKSIDRVVSFLQYPNLTKDVWDIYAAVSNNFERRTGLVEFLQVAETSQSRTATDVRAKAEKAGIRPDYMSHKVEEWLSGVSAMEKLAAYWTGVSGEDVAPLLGQMGAKMWDALFANADPEIMAREMQCRVAAGSARKRNREMELSAIQEFYGPMSQQLGLYRQETGDPIPANNLNNKLFEALNYDGSGLEMRPPPPPPEGADPAQEAIAEQQLNEAEHQAEMQREEEKHDQKMRHIEEEHDQKMTLQEEKGDLEVRQKRAAANAQLRVTRAQARVKAKQPTTR